MSDLDPIFEYLREHSGGYSLSALREQLLQTGYDPALVDRALAIYQDDNPSKVPGSVWPKALPVAAVNTLLLVLTGMNLFWRTFGLEFPGCVLVLVVFAGFLCGVVLTWFRKTEVWGFALLYGFVLSIAVMLLLLGGLCVWANATNPQRH